MRTDGLFTVHEVKFTNWPEGKPLTLIPFGDIHRDSPACSDDKWGEFLERGRKADSRTYFLGMGDYLDSYSTSERAIIYDHRLHESTMKRQEKEAAGRIEKLARELSFAKGRTIGILGGNHFVSFQNGTTGDHLLASKLDTKYLGACSAIRLSFEGGGRRCAVDLFCHHGRGAGRTAGGRYNAVEQLLSVCDADVCLMGDNHACGCFRAGERLFLQNHSTKGLLLRSRPRWVGRTGSFLRGYVPGESSYVVDGALAPANLGWIEFSLTPRRNREMGCTRVEISARQ